MRVAERTDSFIRPPTAPGRPQWAGCTRHGPWTAAPRACAAAQSPPHAARPPAAAAAAAAAALWSGARQRQQEPQRQKQQQQQPTRQQQSMQQAQPTQRQAGEQGAAGRSHAREPAPLLTSDTSSRSATLMPSQASQSWLVDSAAVRQHSTRSGGRQSGGGADEAQHARAEGVRAPPAAAHPRSRPAGASRTLPVAPGAGLVVRLAAAAVACCACALLLATRPAGQAAKVVSKCPARCAAAAAAEALPGRQQRSPLWLRRRLRGQLCRLGGCHCCRCCPSRGRSCRRPCRRCRRASGGGGALPAGSQPSRLRRA